jgi:hypothetical protein
LALVLCRISEYVTWQTASSDSSRLMPCKVAAELTLQPHNPVDLIARFADDCFALLLPDTQLVAATQLANDAQQKLDQLKLPAPNGADSFISMAVGSRHRGSSRRGKHPIENGQLRPRPSSRSRSVNSRHCIP